MLSEVGFNLVALCGFWRYGIVVIRLSVCGFERYLVVAIQLSVELHCPHIYTDDRTRKRVPKKTKKNVGYSRDRDTRRAFWLL